MITSRYAERIAAGMMAAALIACLILTSVAGRAIAADAGSIPVEYERQLFDTDKPMSIDILMDEKQWQELLENASEKKWHSCDVIVNGKHFNNVGIRTKGDSSLSSIAENPRSNRYSFKLKFDKYQKGQSCWGLDKLCLNNNYGDATNMKEAMVYDMFRFLGADASLYNYARIAVNGQYWGVYLAMEAVDDAFRRRNYGAEKGALYKPGNSGGEDEEIDWESEDMFVLEEFESPGATADVNEEGMESESGGEGGAELKYIDDNLDSYWGIWSSQVNKTNDSDHRRVVEALRHIGMEDDPERYMDMDNLLRYMAVHNFSVNNDSLSGDGAHNYYLYESGGRLNIIPWDYNLCFGAYEMEEDMASDFTAETTETAADMVNKPIDDSWSMTSFFDVILQNEVYRAKYHAYYQRLIDAYVLGGGFDVFYARTRSQIDDLVKADPNALYVYDTYDRAAKMLKAAVELRGKSVRGQLNGTIPSTLEGQKAQPERRLDASAIDLQEMGSDSIGEETSGSEGEHLEESDGEEDKDYGDEAWFGSMKDFIEQQKKKRTDTIQRNGLAFALSLFSIAAAIVAVVKFRRRKIQK